MATPKSMCVLTIGHYDYLMPAEAGMKVMQLMQQAVSAERSAEDFRSWHAGRPVHLAMEMVSADKIHMPPGAEIAPARRRATPKSLTQQPLRLTKGS